MASDASLDRSAPRRSRARLERMPDRRIRRRVPAARGSSRRCPGRRPGSRSGCRTAARQHRASAHVQLLLVQEHARRAQPPRRSRASRRGTRPDGRRQRDGPRQSVTQGSDGRAADGPRRRSRRPARPGTDRRPRCRRRGSARGRGTRARHGCSGSTTAPIQLHRPSCQTASATMRRPIDSAAARNAVVRGHGGRRETAPSTARRSARRPRRSGRPPPVPARRFGDASLVRAHDRVGEQRAAPLAEALAVAVSSARPTPGANSRVKAGTRGHRCALSVAAISRSDLASPLESVAPQVQHRRVAAREAERVIGDLQPERHPLRVEP